MDSRWFKIVNALQTFSLSLLVTADAVREEDRGKRIDSVKKRGCSNRLYLRQSK